MAQDNNKILIIDDDSDIVEAMRLVLESKNYEVAAAGSGEEGLKQVKQFDPDLIILDVMMEDLTKGFHVAYTLRSEDAKSEYKQWQKTPILMVTAVHQVMPFRYSKDTDQEYLPVSEFIDKPIQPDQLLSLVNKYLKK